MWWSYWPTSWLLFMPLMMLACMAGMFLMMRAMHGRHHHPNPDVARAGPRLTAPEAALPFEEYRTETLRRLDLEQADFRDFAERLRTARDKAEFDEFMARLDARTAPAPNVPVDGGAHGR